MSLKFIDTHAHLTWKTFHGRIEEVVAKAEEAGVSVIIDIGTDLSNSIEARENAYRFKGVCFCAGIHPNDAALAKDTDIKEIEELCRDPKCVAIGEIGLDFYREHTEPAVQEKWLRLQLQLALSLEKPIVLHDRNASQKLLKILEEENYDGNQAPGGVFHCFAGGKEMVHEVLKRGFYISFTGNLTYNKSDRGKVARTVPLDRLLLETDSPFMAPVPRRGKVNEPAYIPYIAAAHATGRNISLDEVAEQTTSNANNLFKINAII
ncbi:MAG: TatD family hydrolase [Candidatus Electryonea clarkiae]|nr:TatD family hydrolase [Candidatus Electryonea clarkiae]MDP8286252.1 TatD family hydrolase [Candidatus Electryonea clarkiae]